MNGYFASKPNSTKSLFICFIVLSLLQWLSYQLLLTVKLGSTVECFAIAQVFVVLLSAPYLTASSFRTKPRNADSGLLFALSTVYIGKSILRNLAISLFPILCWILISSGFAAIIIGMTIAKVLNMIFVLVIFSFTAGAVGLCGARMLRDNVFGTVLSYSVLCILIFSALLIKPLTRYVENLQPIFKPVLHLNPVIAVCSIFDGLDVLRNPLLYDLTPITSYLYVYPPWYMNVFWQLVLGACSFLWTWQMCKTAKYIRA